MATDDDHDVSHVAASSDFFKLQPKNPPRVDCFIFTFKSLNIHLWYIKFASIVFFEMPHRPSQIRFILENCGHFSKCYS